MLVGSTAGAALLAAGMAFVFLRPPPPPSVATAATSSAAPTPSGHAVAATATPKATSSAAAAASPVCTPRTGPVKLLWMRKDYELELDQAALACLTDGERAAVGYVATVVGSQCDWRSSPNAIGEGALMDCKLTKALGLGPQCETRHKEFLTKWLGDDAPAKCWKIPTTAYSQAVLDEVTLANEGPLILVTFKATGTTGPGGRAWSWSESLTFAPRGDALKLAKRAVKGQPF
jgi:hypothetical protein